MTEQTGREPQEVLEMSRAASNASQTRIASRVGLRNGRHDRHSTRHGARARHG